MEFWLIWLIAGVVFFIIELFTPVLFFLNFAFACFASAFIAYIEMPLSWQIIVFSLISLILLLFIRPLLLSKTQSKETLTGIEGQYIGHIAKTILTTNASDGRVTIYGEEWIARSIDGCEIPANVEVKIVKEEDTILYVEKCSNAQ